MVRSNSDGSEIRDLNASVARSIARQMNNNPTILCPRCKSFGQDQPLSMEGDFPQVLFCPHCNLEVSISVDGCRHHYRGRPISRWKKYILPNGE